LAGYVDLAIAALLIVIGMVFWFLRISYKVGIVGGIMLLVVSAISNWTGNQNLSNLIAIFAYYCLLIGVLFAVVKLRRRNAEPSRDSQVATSEK
jgi:ABC-type proline/glycine betaine transport system permease subunit